MIHAGSIPHDTATHFFYAWDEVAYRSLCDRWTVDKHLVQETGAVTCRVCREPEVDLMGEADVKISGPEPDLTTEEYMHLFNRAVNDGDKLEYYLPAIKDLTPEELVDHINMINKFYLRVKVVKHAAKKMLEERKITLSKDHRDRLRLQDMAYKPKPVPKEGKAAKTPRKRGTAKQQDAIEMMMNLLGISREKAEAKLARAEKKAEAAEESKK